MSKRSPKGHELGAGFEAQGFSNIDEVVAFTGLSARKVAYMVSQGELTHYKVGRRLMFRLSEVIEDLGAFRVASKGNGQK